MLKKELIGFSIALFIIAVIAISGITLGVIANTNANKEKNKNQDEEKLTLDTVSAQKVDSAQINIVSSSSDLLYTLPIEAGNSEDILTVSENESIIQWRPINALDRPETSKPNSIAIFKNDNATDAISSSVLVNSGKVSATKLSIEDSESILFTLPITAGAQDTFLEFLDGGPCTWNKERISTGDVFGPDYSQENAICTFSKTDGKKILSSNASITEGGVIKTSEFSANEITIVDDDKNKIYALPQIAGTPGQSIFTDNLNNVNMIWKNPNSADVFIAENPKTADLVSVFANDEDGEILTTEISIKENIIYTKAVSGQVAPDNQDTNENLIIAIDEDVLKGKLFIGSTKQKCPIEINTDGIYFGNKTFSVESDGLTAFEIDGSSVVLIKATANDLRLKFPPITEGEPLDTPGTVPIGTQIDICNVSDIFNLVIPKIETKKNEFDIYILPGHSCRITALEANEKWSFMGDAQIQENGLSYGQTEFEKKSNTSQNFDPIVFPGTTRNFKKFFTSVLLPEGIVVDMNSGQISFSGQNSQTEPLNFTIAGTFKNGYAYTTDITVTFST